MRRRAWEPRACNTGEYVTSSYSRITSVFWEPAMFHTLSSKGRGMLIRSKTSEEHSVSTYRIHGCGLTHPLTRDEGGRPKIVCERPIVAKYGRRRNREGD